MAKTPPSTTDPSSDLPQEAVGKGHATPTRREKEAARKRPLVSSDRGEARKHARAQQQIQRDKARIGLANGEEKYLPARDRGPQKRYVRDYVDARLSLGEALLPFLFIVIVATIIPSQDVVAVLYIVVYGFITVAIVDVVVLGFILKRRLADKFGADRVESFRFY
ncbi:MAG: DUF3043 domain-containing protein, partial [Rhodoglobus sp.]|nr:DUF3043 domain-containing protein [Rhodoglobus sp.]